MSTVTPSSDQSAYGRARTVGSVLASATKELGIAVFAGVWTVVWIALSVESAEAEGMLNGIIVGSYTLLPIVGVVFWRLGERTSFSPPTIDDLVGPDDSSDDADKTANDEVVDRYAFGED